MASAIKFGTKKTFSNIRHRYEDRPKSSVINAGIKNYNLINNPDLFLQTDSKTLTKRNNLIVSSPVLYSVLHCNGLITCRRAILRSICEWFQRHILTRLHWISLKSAVLFFVASIQRIERNALISVHFTWIRGNIYDVAGVHLRQIQITVVVFSECAFKNCFSVFI